MGLKKDITCISVALGGNGKWSGVKRESRRFITKTYLTV